MASSTPSNAPTAQPPSGSDKYCPQPVPWNKHRIPLSIRQRLPEELHEEGVNISDPEDHERYVDKMYDEQCENEKIVMRVCKQKRSKLSPNVRQKLEKTLKVLEEERAWFEVELEEVESKIMMIEECLRRVRLREEGKVEVKKGVKEQNTKG